MMLLLQELELKARKKLVRMGRGSAHAFRSPALNLGNDPESLHGRRYLPDQAKSSSAIVDMLAMRRQGAEQGRFVGMQIPRGLSGRRDNSETSETLGA